MAFTPADAEDELEVLDDMPIATRLRSHSKIGDAKISQPQSNGDKSNQSSRNPHAKSKHLTPKKSLVLNASSPLRIGQPSTSELTEKSSGSTYKKSVHTTFPSRTGQPLTVDSSKKNSESKSKKRVHFKDSALMSETHITSSKTSQLLKDQGANNSKDSVVIKKREIHVTSTKTSEASNDEGDKNSKDSTPKRSRILISSSGSKNQSSKDHHVTEKKIKDSTPKKSETTGKHLTKPLLKGKDSQLKRESSQYSEKTVPSAKPVNLSEFRAPMYYIRWGGLDKPRTQSTGWNCDLCEKDLTYSPIDENSEQSLPPELELADIDYADFEFGDSLLPEVDVLPCNHVFHSMCLQLAASEEQVTDLYCSICGSWS